MALCLPHYRKTYNQDVYPGAIDDAGRMEHPTTRTGQGFGANHAILDWRFQPPMFKTPVAIPYSPVTGVPLKASDSDVGEDKDASSFNPGDGGTGFLVTEGPSTGTKLSIHATAEAEIHV
jgi:hypothetical protein